MKPPASVVRPELMSLPVEAPSVIQNIKGRRAVQPSQDASSSPWSGCNTTAKCNGQKYPYRPSYSSDVKSQNVKCLIEGSFLPFIAKGCLAMSKYISENNVFDNDRHFLFDKRWRNGVYITSNTGDDVLIKQSSTLPLPFPEFHIYQSHNLTRFSHRKEFNLGNPKQLVFGADYLTSFPSVLLPATTPSVSDRLCSSQNCKNRTRMKNRARNLFAVGAKNRTQSYPDPLLGATASFVQRVTEISSLEAETVRRERIKRLKKINRQDS